MLLISSTSGAISWVSTSKRGLQSLTQVVRELGIGHRAWGIKSASPLLPSPLFPLPSVKSVTESVAELPSPSVKSVTESVAELLSLKISIENSSSFPARLFPAK